MSKYVSPPKYASFARGFANRHLLPYFEPFLSSGADRRLVHAPIFVVGPPRSGSTLAFQVITDALDVGYLSNGHCEWHGAPALYERLSHPTTRRPQSDYLSNHGDTEGRYAPSECGTWWYRFFRREPPYVTLADVQYDKMRDFRRSVASLTDAFDRPVLFKNLYASLRIQAIAHYLPESLFIVMHRDEVDNGHSLLEARLKSFGSYEPWFSVKPVSVEELKKLPANAQVIEQVREIHRTINDDLAKMNVTGSRRFDLVYEEFCANPVGAVNAIQAFLQSNACSVKPRGITLPVKFDVRRDIRIDQRVFDAMASYSCGSQSSQHG